MAIFTPSMTEQFTTENTPVKDKAGEEYWTKFWQNFPLPEPIVVSGHSVNNYPYRILHKLFQKAFKGMNTGGMKILEIGCGNSVFLSYFQKEFGFDVYGLDYSELGCRQTEKIFERDHITGKVFLADAFSPPSDLLNAFDVVCSFGVVEHFTDTAGTLESFSKFVKPGGLLITSVPNFKGATGTLHKLLNKPVYDIHVPLDKEDLVKASDKANLKVEVAEYFLAVSFAITLEGHEGRKVPYATLKKVFVKSIRYASKILWIFEDIFGTIPPGKRLSGGVFLSCRKKDG